MKRKIQRKKEIIQNGLASYNKQSKKLILFMYEKLHNKPILLK